jgi:hypothetical protein
MYELTHILDILALRLKKLEFMNYSIRNHDTQSVYFSKTLLSEKIRKCFHLETNRQPEMIRYQNYEKISWFFPLNKVINSCSVFFHMIDAVTLENGWDTSLLPHNKLRVKGGRGANCCKCLIFYERDPPTRGVKNRLNSNWVGLLIKFISDL